MKRIDRSEVPALLGAGRKGTVICTIFLASPLDNAMNKTNNPFYGKGLIKETSLTVVTGFRYQAAVAEQTRKQMKKAGVSVEAIEAAVSAIPFGERKWGIKREDRKFIDHKGEVYIACYVRSSTKPVYRQGKEIIDVEMVRPYLKDKGESKAQAHLEDKNKVIYRDLKVENILCIRYRKEDYLVDDLEPLTGPDEVESAPKNPALDELLEAEFGLQKLIENGEISTD